MQELLLFIKLKLILNIHNSNVYQAQMSRVLRLFGQFLKREYKRS